MVIAAELMRHYKDIEQRRVAWKALSELFLDTDISLHYGHIAIELAKTHYTINELEQIYIQDVYPVCKWNLLATAGEWVAFDVEDLERRISNRKVSFRFGWNVYFGKRHLKSSLDWPQIKKMIIQNRDEALV